MVNEGNVASCKKGKVIYQHALVTRFGNGKKMTNALLFLGLASQTKAHSSVAVMLLQEEGNS